MNKNFTDLIEYPDNHEKEVHDKISILHDWRATFETPEGRRVLMDILDSTFMYDSIYTGNAKTYYNAAFQDFGKKILDTLATASPETYLWVYKQRINYLKEQLGEEVKQVREDEAR